MTDRAVVCRVAVEGEDLTDLVVRLQVDESDRRADMARLVFGDSLLVLCDVLHEGLAIEIELGHTDEHAVVFRGIVTAVTAVFPPVGSPTVELVAHDRLILLGLRSRTRRWGNANVSTIVREVARDHQLVPGRIDVTRDASYPAERPAQQVAETDLALLERLAGEHDAKLFIDHSGQTDQLCLVANATLEAAEPLPQSLVFNASLTDFRAGFDAWATDPSEELVTTDLDGNRITVSRRLLQGDDTRWTPDATRMARLGGGAGRLATVSARAASTRACLSERWRVPPRAAGVPARPSGDERGTYGDRLRRRGQTGQGRAGGAVWLRPRARVQIVGYGGRWSGVWTLARVRHDVELATRRYTTSFTCVR
jgi:uncharacterized protein involved in type VI secretion and phage assembly